MNGHIEKHKRIDCKYMTIYKVRHDIYFPSFTKTYLVSQNYNVA